MATTLYFRNDASLWSYTSPGNVPGGGTQLSTIKLLSTTRGGAAVSAATNTVTGTSPVPVVQSGLMLVWYSDPLAAPVTISGSITWNLRAAESSMSANVAINGQVSVQRAASGEALIDQTARVTELGLTTEAVNNFSETPAAGVVCNKGDRLRIVIFGDDVAGMVAGFTFTFWFGGPTGGASGDSFITFTENLTFATAEPAGSTIYLTNTASPVVTAANDLEAWTSRGAGVQSGVTTISGGSGWVATDTGGTSLAWFTRPLAAMTLGGTVRVNIRGLESVATLNDGVAIQIARVNGDGTSSVSWVLSQMSPTELGTTETVLSFIASGNDLVITDGQRLHIYLMFYAVPGQSPGSGSATIFWAGTAGGASGDTYLTFSQTLTEFITTPPRVPYFRPYTQLVAH